MMAPKKIMKSHHIITSFRQVFEMQQSTHLNEIQ